MYQTILYCIVMLIAYAQTIFRASGADTSRTGRALLILLLVYYYYHYYYYYY